MFTLVMGVPPHICNTGITGTSVLVNKLCATCTSLILTKLHPIFGISILIFGIFGNDWYDDNLNPKPDFYLPRA